MSEMMKSTVGTFRHVPELAAAAARRMNRTSLAWAAVGLAGLCFLSVNLVATSALRPFKADLTSEGLYTISDGTRKALAAIDEPIDLRIYFSRRLGEAAPQFAKSFERVRTLLEQYRSISGGKLRIAYFDPVAFSDAEDRAVAAGMRGIPLNSQGELGYFGLTGTNSTDDQQSIAFFTPERDRFVEYDVTRLIYALANPTKPTIGLLSTLPVDGGLDPLMGMRGPPLPAQTVMGQIRDVFEVKTLDKAVASIPSDIDVLMLVQPEGLSPETAYAIDQFALRGGKVLAFVDPVAESFRPGPLGLARGGLELGEFQKVLAAWGIAIDGGKVAGDASQARRVQFGGGPRPTVTDYVTWLALDRRNLDERDVLSVSAERINVGSAGVLTRLDGATTTVQPVLQTSSQAMRIASSRVTGEPDPVALLRSYKPEGQPLTIAARVSGQTKSAFPDGKPATPSTEAAKDAAEQQATQAAAAPAVDRTDHIGTGRINAIVIADSDLLGDQFWVEVRQFLGQQITIPHAQNAAFVVGALENLSGSDALLSLRARGITERPFEWVEAIRRRAEAQFRAKEEELTANLKGVQEKLSALERNAESGSVVLSEADQKAIESFRAEMLAIRRDLRDVKLALRQDIDRLDGWLKFANIAGVPLMIGVLALGIAAQRRRRT